MDKKLNNNEDEERSKDDIYYDKYFDYLFDIYLNMCQYCENNGYSLLDRSSGSNFFEFSKKVSSIYENINIDVAVDEDEEDNDELKYNE